MTNRTLSIVVIGRDEGVRLRSCIESIRKMLWLGTPFELIYVDSGSSDGSPELAQSLDAQAIVVRPTRPTAALARNAGWRKCTGELVLFLDGDTILDPWFVRDSLGAFEDPRTAVVWGNRREIHPEASLFNRVLDLDWICPPGVSEACGGDALMRRSALDQVGGFDETLIAGEEPELCARLRLNGWQMIHFDRSMTGHDLAMHDFSQYWRRATRTGYAYSEVSWRFKESATPLWLSQAQRNRNQVFFLCGGVLGTVGACFIFRSAWPAGLASAAFLLLLGRTARRARWRSSNLLTILLYAVHSHLQQIPIYCGQLQQQRDRHAGRRRGIIEYKTAP